MKLLRIIFLIPIFIFSRTELPFTSIFKNDIESVKKAINNGANVNKEGNDLLYTSVFENDIESVKKAINNGANVNKEGPDGSPLFMAARYGYAEIVQLLIENGANVNYYSKNNSKRRGTSLYIAIRNNYSEVVEILLKNGADKRDIKGENYQYVSSGSGRIVSVRYKWVDITLDDIIERKLNNFFKYFTFINSFKGYDIEYIKEERENFKKILKLLGIRKELSFNIYSFHYFHFLFYIVYILATIILIYVPDKYNYSLGTSVFLQFIYFCSTLFFTVSWGVFFHCLFMFIFYLIIAKPVFIAFFSEETNHLFFFTIYYILTLSLILIYFYNVPMNDVIDFMKPATIYIILMILPFLKIILKKFEKIYYIHHIVIPILGYILYQLVYSLHVFFDYFSNISIFYHIISNIFLGLFILNLLSSVHIVIILYTLHSVKSNKINADEIASNGIEIFKETPFDDVEFNKLFFGFISLLLYIIFSQLNTETIIIGGM